MRRTTIHLVTGLLVAGFAGCDASEQETKPTTANPVATSINAKHVDDRSTADLMEAAQDIHAKALSLGHGWEVTATHLAAAQAHLDAREDDAARASALRAVTTAQASFDQAHSEQSAWQDRFPN